MGSPIEQDAPDAPPATPAVTSAGTPAAPVVAAGAAAEKPPEERMRILVVTGVSGAGKSTALRALEDIGYYCVDNLPLPLLGQFVSLLDKTDHTLAALVINAREGDVLDGRFILRRVGRESVDFAFVGLPPEITRRIPVLPPDALR